MRNWRMPCAGSFSMCKGISMSISRNQRLAWWLLQWRKTSIVTVCHKCHGYTQVTYDPGLYSHEPQIRRRCWNCGEYQYLWPQYGGRRHQGIQPDTDHQVVEMPETVATRTNGVRAPRPRVESGQSNGLGDPRGMVGPAQGE